VFWVISVYFNIRNTLPKSGTFLLGHPVYSYRLMVADRHGKILQHNLRKQEAVKWNSWHR
jgi:hypothetical protein